MYIDHGDPGPDNPMDDPWTDGHRPHGACGTMVEDHALIDGDLVCPAEQPSTTMDAIVPELYRQFGYACTAAATENGHITVLRVEGRLDVVALAQAIDERREVGP